MMSQPLETVLAAFALVYKVLGPGFHPKVYTRAMCLELQRKVLKVEREQEINVYYRGVNVGQFKCDLMADGIVVLIRSAIPTPEDRLHLTSYLKAAGGERMGLLLGFGSERTHEVVTIV